LALLAAALAPLTPTAIHPVSGAAQEGQTVNPPSQRYSIEIPANWAISTTLNIPRPFDFLVQEQVFAAPDAEALAS
jgi:hypothetical protein